VESVAWIAEQKNTLSTVFYLGAALAYLRFDAQRRTSQYLAASGLFVLALLSKTATATLPAALLVVIWWQRSRLGWKRDVLPLLPWFAIAALAGFVTVVVEQRLTAGFQAAFALTAIERGLLAGRIIWFYLLKVVWPAHLTFFYDRWTVDAEVWWQYLFPLTVVAVAASLWLATRLTRGSMARTAAASLAAFLLFGGTLFPVLGFFDVEWFVFSFVADHLQYLANLGVVVALSAGLTRAAGQVPHLPRQLTPALAAILVAVLGVLTWRHSARFADSVTLYGHAVALNPDSALTHNHYGVALARIPGREPEAIAQFGAALRINPDAAEVHENLGATLMRIPGRLAEAIPHLEMALQLKPGLTTVHAKLGMALSQVPDRRPDAIAHLRAALRHEPRNPNLHDYLANALAQTADGLPEAIAEYGTALRLKPDYAGAHFDLGKALARTPGRERDAITEYEKALSLDPRLAEAHFNLGNALLKSPGRRSEAIAHFEAALRLRPEFTEAHTNLGTALAGIPGRLPDAIGHFEAALRITPDFAPALNNLRNARQLLGELSDPPR
jgi:tetratricopeptide (TPR) repeat protein